MELKRKETIGWIDLLRVIACFLVVFAHCCDPFVARFDTDRSTFLQGCAAGSAVRSCVPLFVMMTGVLLFPLRSSMNEFYRKRIGRIVPPLIFWSVMLPVLYFVYLNYIATTDNPTIDMSTFTWQMTVTKICTFIFNFNYDTTPLWYLYMLIGLYFVIPVFGAWLDRASQKDVKLFLRICPCSYNPEPIAVFFDMFYIGEGEVSYRKLLDVYKESRKNGDSRQEFLRKAAGIPGIYVPSLYEVTYEEDGTIRSFLPFSSGMTRPIALAAPVVLGTMFCAPARARRRSPLR